MTTTGDVPAPDLHELIEHHGGYDKIPPEAWTEYDRALADWQERRRFHLGRSDPNRAGGLAGAPSLPSRTERPQGAVHLRPRRCLHAVARGWRPTDLALPRAPQSLAGLHVA